MCSACYCREDLGDLDFSPLGRYDARNIIYTWQYSITGLRFYHFTSSSRLCALAVNLFVSVFLTGTLDEVVGEEHRPKPTRPLPSPTR